MLDSVLHELENCDMLSLVKVKRADGRISYVFENKHYPDDGVSLSESHFRRFIEELNSLLTAEPAEEDWEPPTEDSFIQKE